MLAQKAIEMNGGQRPAYIDLFEAAAHAQMETRPQLPRHRELTGPVSRMPKALGRRSRLERFHRHGPAIPAEDAGKARTRYATQWIDWTLLRFHNGPPQGRKEGIQVARMSPEVRTFVRNKGFDPRDGSMVLQDSALLHMRRDPKARAGKTLPEDAICNMPKHLSQPKSVLWEKRADGKPTLIYVFDLDGDAR